MEKNKKIFWLSPLKITTVILVIATVFVFSTSFKNNEIGGKAKPVADFITSSKDDSIKESKAAFLKAYTVFMNPRCMNCHPKGDRPLQGDDSHIHLQYVVRGADGKGMYALKCKNCHQDTNLADAGTPPGNPHWQMPPANRPMVFQGKTPKELATHFKNNDFTGFKSLNDMIKHVDEESLVISSFNPPPGVTKIPMSHEEFVNAIKEWIAKGAAIPDK